MDFMNQAIDISGALLCFNDGDCVRAIKTNFVKMKSGSIRYKNEYGKMEVLDTEKYQHIAFKKECAVFAEDVILLK